MSLPYRRFCANSRRSVMGFEAAFDQGGLEAVFVHIRNLVISTLIIAATVHATVYGSSTAALAVFGSNRADIIQYP